MNGPPPRSRRGRAWTEDAVRDELTRFLADRTTWPTYREFTAAGAKGLREAIARIGGADYWAREMGLADRPRPRGGVLLWTDEKIHAVLAEMLADRDSWPTRTEFAQAGLRGLAEVLRERGEAPTWARRMGVKPPRRLSKPPRTGSPTSRRPGSPHEPWPRWTERTIATALTGFLEDREEWPRHSDFVAAGHKGLYHAILKHGGSRFWARRMGVRWVKRTGGPDAKWTEERVRAELSSFLAGREAWPTEREFTARGQRPLLSAARKLGGTEKWRREFSLPRISRRAVQEATSRPAGQNTTRRLAAQQHWTDERIEAAIAPLVEELGRWPTKAEFRRAGQGHALSAVYDHGGSTRWQQHFGVKPRRPSGPVPDRTRWTEQRIERELRELLERLGRWPTEKELREHVPAGLYSALVRYGGVRKWRKHFSSGPADPVAR